MSTFTRLGLSLFRHQRCFATRLSNIRTLATDPGDGYMSYVKDGILKIDIGPTKWENTRYERTTEPASFQHVSKNMKPLVRTVRSKKGLRINNRNIRYISEEKSERDIELEKRIQEAVEKYLKQKDPSSGVQNQVKRAKVQETTTQDAKPLQTAPDVIMGLPGTPHSGHDDYISKMETHRKEIKDEESDSQEHQYWNQEEFVDPMKGWSESKRSVYYGFENMGLVTHQYNTAYHRNWTREAMYKREGNRLLAFFEHMFDKVKVKVLTPEFAMMTLYDMFKKTPVREKDALVKKYEESKNMNRMDEKVPKRFLNKISGEWRAKMEIDYKCRRPYILTIDRDVLAFGEFVKKEYAVARAVLTSHGQHSDVDLRLYLLKKWNKMPKRLRKMHLPSPDYDSTWYRWYEDL